MHEIPDLSRLSAAEKDALILALFERAKQVERLTAAVPTLSARVRELEGELRKDNRNSGEPPSSSDRSAKKPKSLVRLSMKYRWVNWLPLALAAAFGALVLGNGLDLGEFPARPIVTDFTALAGFAFFVSLVVWAICTNIVVCPRCRHTVGSRFDARICRRCGHRL